MGNLYTTTGKEYDYTRSDVGKPSLASRSVTERVDRAISLKCGDFSAVREEGVAWVSYRRLL